MMTLAATALTATAHAGSLSLDLRADYNSSTYDKSTIADSTRYYFKTGRLDYQGKALEDLSFRVRLAFNKNATTQATDNGQTSLEYAYLTHKMSEMFSLSVGKINSEIGGFEGATSGADLYLTSTFYTRSPLTASGLTTGSLSPNVLGTTNLLYMTGVKGTFSFEGQVIHILATDETADGSAGPAATQNGSLYGIDWKGAFLDKALNFNVSYHTMGGPTKDDRHQFVAAGVMWNSNPVVVTAEYLMAEYKQDTPSAKDTTTSIVAKAAYTGWEQWTPRLEVVSTEEKMEIGASATHKIMGYGAVLEYKPYTDTNFRYHMAYSYQKESPETGDDITKQEVVVGARLLADFLK